MVQSTVAEATGKCCRTRCYVPCMNFLTLLFVYFVVSLLRSLGIPDTNPLSDVQMVKIPVHLWAGNWLLFKLFNRNINILIKMYLLCCEQIAFPMEMQVNFSLHFIMSVKT